MSVIYGNPIITSGGGVKLNIDYGATPPSDTTKLWVPLTTKPSAVECSPVLNYGSEIVSTTPYSLPANRSSQGFQNTAVGKYIYVVGGVAPANAQSDIIRFDTETGVSETVKNLGFSWTGGTVCAIEDKLYCFGGYPKKAFVFDTTNNTITDLAVFPDNFNSYCSASYYNGNIYICGGQSGQYKYQYIRVYNISANTYSIFNGVSITTPSVVALNGKLYIIGGIANVASNKIYIYDIATQTRLTETKIAENGEAYCIGAPCMAYGKYIYVVCDSAGAGNPPYKVVRFDTETNTGTIINTNFSECANCSFFGTIGSKLWVLGGTREVSAQASVSSARTFAVNTPLQSNNLFLQADFGFNNPFPLINDGKTKITAYLRNAYLGDSNNIAQLTNAYLYDSKDLKWKSLTGESYVADMQNALNILGVT